MSAREYFRTQEMQGSRPFRCFNCGAMMIRHFVGNCFSIGLECRRCKCKIHIECKEAIPAAMDIKPDDVEVGWKESNGSGVRMVEKWAINQ